MPRLRFLSLSLAFIGLAGAAFAEDYVITLNDHVFSPKTLVIPAGQKVSVTVKNQQATPAEFESEQLGREKVVAAGSQIIVSIGPLQAGDYVYKDDFHDESTGTITAK